MEHEASKQKMLIAASSASVSTERADVSSEFQNASKKVTALKTARKRAAEKMAVAKKMMGVLTRFSKRRKKVGQASSHSQLVVALFPFTHTHFSKLITIFVARRC